MAVFPIRTHDQKAVLSVSLIFSALAIVAVTLRLISHAVARKRWIISDYLIIVACILAVALQSLSVVAVLVAGMGYGHVADVQLEYGLAPIIKMSKLIIPLSLLWVLSVSCSKLSILCLYLRIFPIRWLKWASYATIYLIIAWTIATVLSNCLICRPFAFNWDKTIPGGSCGNQLASFTVGGVINLITDLLVVLLPMKPLLQLQLVMYKKMVLVSIFGLGIITCVISAVRVSLLVTTDLADITFTAAKTCLLTGLEPCLAVILASVPMMRPLLGRSVATPYKLSERTTKANSKTNGPKRLNDDGFERLDDDTGHLQLRPMGVQSRTDSSTSCETPGEDASDEDGEPIQGHNV